MLDFETEIEKTTLQIFTLSLCIVLRLVFSMPPSDISEFEWKDAIISRLLLIFLEIFNPTYGITASGQHQIVVILLGVIYKK